MTKPEPQPIAASPALIDFITKHHEPKVIKVTGQDGTPTEILILPAGLKAEGVKAHLDAYRTAPERRKGTATMKSLASFIDYVNRFRDPNSSLFAWPDMAKPSLTCVFDHHEGLRLVTSPSRTDDKGFEHPPAYAETTDPSPRFGQHRAVYDFPLSKEWQAWLAKNKTVLGQRDFAEFLEDRIPDVLDPGHLGGSEVKTPDGSLTLQEMAEILGGDFATPARLMQLSRGLKVHADERVGETVNLSTGETEIIFSAEHKDEAGQKIKVPPLFLIGIPVFEMGEVFRIPVRLRYRKSQGGIVWFYEIWRTEKAFDLAFNEACHDAAKQTGLPKFLGAPEASS